jgi:hypothetical protein
MKINNIVIVGGGSAGWMTASILIKSFPNKNITVVESPNIPTVGVGESTYEGINYYLEYLGIDRNDFFKYTDATIKLAIQFKNFYKEDGHDDFIYPFGIANIDENFWGLQDWQIKKSCYPETPIQEYAESHFPAALLVKHNRLSDNHENLPGFDQILSTALHFDAIKFALWLKNNYAMPKGVKNILQTVESAELNENGISYLVLDDGEKVFADLYIDCTGFQSLLMKKFLKEDFISYNDVLPNTNAWATQITYKNKNAELENVTRCTAIENGWCWNIPLWSRIGSGYVYSSKYVSHEDALKEFKNYLQKDLKIPRSKSEIDKMNFKNIDMRVGIYKNVWSKNVVAIGLSAGFIEPLESNGLFSVHEFLFELCSSLTREEITQWDKDVFNYAVRLQFDKFVEFIRLHYALSVRKKSKYWENNSKQSYDFFKILNNDPFANHLLETQRARTLSHLPPNLGGITWITSGMNYMVLDPVSVRLAEISDKINCKKDLKEMFLILDKKRKSWENFALECETTTDYLKRKYHE